jgi:hypothetical protein
LRKPALAAASEQRAAPRFGSCTCKTHTRCKTLRDVFDLRRMPASIAHTSASIQASVRFGMSSRPTAGAHAPSQAPALVATGRMGTGSRHQKRPPTEPDGGRHRGGDGGCKRPEIRCPRQEIRSRPVAELWPSRSSAVNPLWPSAAPSASPHLAVVRHPPDQLVAVGQSGTPLECVPTAKLGCRHASLG